MIKVTVRNIDDQNEAKKIKTALKQTMGTGQYARVAVVNMVCINGLTISVVAGALGVSRGIIHYWLDIYDREGITGLADGTKPGRPLSCHKTS